MKGSQAELVTAKYLQIARFWRGFTYLIKERSSWASSTSSVTGCPHV